MMQEWRSETLEGKPAGLVKNFENFTFLRVFDAGHMVPTDQPEVALDMINEFLLTKKISPVEPHK